MDLPVGRRSWHPVAMSGADLKPRRQTRAAVVLLVVLLHLALVVVLIRAFAPEFAATTIGSLTRTFDIPLEPPPPDPPLPSPTPHLSSPPQKKGAAGSPGKRAEPRPIAAPQPAVRIATTEAPTIAGNGPDHASGGQDVGAGTGAAGASEGRGAGGSGSGSGGGGGIAAKPVKIAGDINSARDYPSASRELRLGSQVVVALRVGTDGQVKGCRVIQASPDAEADRITCRLATERFRFKPARDAKGNAVEAEYGWRQRWFLKTRS